MTTRATTATQEMTMPTPDAAARLERHMALRAILREHRRDGCSETRKALAATIYDLRAALRDLQGHVLDREQTGER